MNTIDICLAGSLRFKKRLIHTPREERFEMNAADSPGASVRNDHNCQFRKPQATVAASKAANG